MILGSEIFLLNIVRQNNPYLIKVVKTCQSMQICGKNERFQMYICIYIYMRVYLGKFCPKDYFTLVLHMLQTRFDENLMAPRENVRGTNTTISNATNLK